MHRIANMAPPGGYSDSAAKNHSSQDRTKTASLSPLSGAIQKATQELSRFVDFLARYEARQTVAAAEQHFAVGRNAVVSQGGHQ